MRYRVHTNTIVVNHGKVKVNGKLKMAISQSYCGNDAYSQMFKL